MKLKTILLILLLASYQLSIAQGYSYVPKFSSSLDSSKGSHMLSQCSRSVPEHIKSFWNVDSVEVDRLHNNFRKLTGIASKGCCSNDYKVSKLNSYVYQYVGVVINGEKYIYINAFAIEDESYLTRFRSQWRTDPIIVCDGGRSYWGALFNLKDETFSDLSMNGSS